jgi:tetratricopeptide (TPR) repeat protein
MKPRKWSPVARLPALEFEGSALKAQWARLHRGDREPFPTKAALAHRLKADEGRVRPAEAAEGVQNAWRAFHAGDFQRAYQMGSSLGLPGFAVALKAVGVYATAVEKNAHDAEQLLLDASNRAEDILRLLPTDANAHYMCAFTLGRYSQRISIAEALARGFASKIENSLEHALKLQPRHADAHTALGVYHAEIVGKLGSLAARLTYGASGEKAIEHFKKALKLDPDAPVVKVEYAKALHRLDQDAYADQIDALLTAAAECEPADAMEWLDRERAREHRGKIRPV